MAKAGNNEDRREISRLKTELFFAWQAVINLMPEDVKQILESYSDVEPRQSAKWVPRIVEQLVVKAELFPDIDRAYCPLCGRGSSSPIDNGFSVPTGLTRHLVGWGNTTQCPVMRAAVGLAKDYWESPFPKIN